MTFENPFEGKTVWFGVGSQDLYGEEALRQVAEQSTKIVDALNATGKIPVKLVLKPTLKSSDGVKQFMTEASADPSCIGVIAWMHTFSPAKMWIAACRCSPSRCCSSTPSSTRRFRGTPSTWTS